ncbi:hypothetical protein KDL44_13795 [bacterium]|nr:hypothetical protein [bacterium]
MRNALLTLALLVASLSLASCGGGGAADSGLPQQQSTTLSGHLSIDSGVRGTSALSGLNGRLSVIDAGSGELQATTMTNGGNFNFSNLQEGENLLKLEFTSDFLLGQDGGNELELLVPVTVVGGQGNTFDGSVSFPDLNDDGSPDAVQIDSDVNGEPDTRLIEPGDGSVRIDDDGDGHCMDEPKLRDLDGDGLPEDAHGRDHSLRGGIIKGPIESISETELVVNGILFNITDATHFKDHGNRNPDMELFKEGTNVHVRALWNGEEWTALQVKTTGVRDDDNKGKGKDKDRDDDDDDDDSGDDDSGDDDSGNDGGGDDGTDDQGSGDA